MDPGTVVSILSCLCPTKFLQETGGRQCKYLQNPKVKIEELRLKMEHLRTLVGDVNGSLERAWIKEGMETIVQAKKWLENARKLYTNEVQDLLPEQEKRCLCGCVPNYYSRMKLAKLFQSTIENVDELLSEGLLIKNAPLAYLVPEKVKTVPTTVMVGSKSTRARIQQIWKHLVADDEVRKIGVYGIGGVGKTTIMKEINNRLKKEMEYDEITCFDNVIWIEVPEDSNTKELQKTIAQSVSLDLNDYSNITDKARRLWRALRQKQRLLLIFDNLWTKFSLEEIGIPAPTADNGCKIIFTTRSLKVCRAMETDEAVEVKVLPEEESWNLFTEKVGSVLQKPEIEHLARGVAQMLGGLPLAISTVGRALRKVDNVREWENALTGLMESAADVEGMEEMVPVFSCLRFSYDRLDGGLTQSCFLYCALYPRGYQIEAKELIEYWMWEGLLGEVGTIKAQRWKGEMILANLRASCMLENVDADAGVECVKMHDLIREMAINITKSSPRCLIRSGVGAERNLLAKEEIEEVKWISMMYNDMTCIPTQPYCPQLSSLLLQYSSADKMPPGVCLSFTETPHLKVLDMSFTGIKSLSMSIRQLPKLRALLLRSCWNLTRLQPCLDSLQSLWDLDLSYTPITKLPLGMHSLLNLKRLNLSYTQLDTFPAGLLTTLTFLEELLLFRCKFAFALQLVNELIRCLNIVVLEVQFGSPEVFHMYTSSGHWNNLQSFRFDICSDVDWRDQFGELQEHVEKKNSITCMGNFFVTGAPVLLPDSTSELQLWHCHDVDRLSRCLSDSIQLKRYLTGFVLPGTHDGLKILQISYCDSLVTVFTIGLIEHLGNLEQLAIKSCSKLELLVEEEQSIQKAEVNLPRLKNLELHDLRELTSIFSGEVICNSMCTITVQECPQLKRLPIRILIDEGDQQRQPSTTPPIKKIIAERWWWNSVQLDSPGAKTFLQNRWRSP